MYCDPLSNFVAVESVESAKDCKVGCFLTLSTEHQVQNVNLYYKGDSTSCMV